VRVGDAYGEMLMAGLEDPEIPEIVERDDGFVNASRYGPAVYLAPYPKWPSRERQAFRNVRGRVLDVGSGGGRVALRLQEKGHEVVSIDASPGAVKACKRRGVKNARVLRIEDLDESLGVFDTVVMYGNNLGLLGGRAKGRRLLKTLHRITSPEGRIIGESVHVYDTKDPLHLAYHERNRRRGRMGGQLKLRVRYRDVATPWFDYLLLTPEELGEMADGTGWHITRTYENEPPFYVAVMEKEPRARASRTG
jgi:SAM-dependent methyltransferase